MSLEYLNCFVVVLIGIHGKADVCQTDYSIYCKLKMFPHSKVIHRGATFKLTKG